MTKRIISLVLVFVMLFAICVSTVSCAQLEEFIGEENLGEDYLNKYYPDRNNGVADGGNNNSGNNGNGGSTNSASTGEHASYAEKKEGYNLITFFWNNPLIKDMSNCDLWFWYGDVSDAIVWEPCEYGGRVTLSVPEDVTEVGFIARKYCTQPGNGSSWGNAEKDCGPDDLFATIEGDETFIYLRGGASDSNQYHSPDYGKTLTVIKKFNMVGITDSHTLEYYITPATKLSNINQIKVMDGDKELAITKVTNLNKTTNSGKITVDADLDITKNYTIHIDGFGEVVATPTKIFDSEWFAENYHYDGTDLGATINADGTTTFKVWAPTASKVVLNLYKEGGKDKTNPEDKSFDMTRGEKGVWTYTAPGGHGTYYTYSVTTSVGTQEAVDPYAKSAGVNGDRGMVVDLALTDPEGWANDQKFTTGIDSYSDAVIWEIHIRDFSNTINFGNKEANDKYQGKYLAFTQEGLVNEHGIPVGIDYLKALGVNFVHLLPSYDYATVKEENPDSGFNWGYDPKNYNVPEGSYSTDPYNGAVRVKEYKEMVMALHEAGIGVIMDVVYNHTYDKNACFNKIVPNYYYRYKPNGANSSGSGCGNDTASERYMYGKFMVESVEYWISEYNLDGFRFDLMGLHDVNTMQKIESTVHAIDPQAVLYGEGWTMMQHSYNKTLRAATQDNINRVKATNGGIGAIAVFNDIIRTGLKGEDNDTSKGYLTGKTDDYTRRRVLFGVNGGVGSGAGANWSTPTAMVVNYMSAHDGSTIWDKLAISNKYDSIDERLKMNRLGATILFASKGIVFFQAGEEMLRSKPNSDDPNGFDRNSYSSSDAVNNLRWDKLTPTSNEYKMFQYYAGLCAIRTKIDIFTNNTSFTTYAHGDNSGFSIVIEDGNGGKAYVIVNPDASRSISYTLDGSYQLICDGEHAGTSSIRTCSGTISVPARSAYILVSSNLLP